MAFNYIDIDNWNRKEHYLSFIGNNLCNYSMTVNMDITALKGEKLYPAMIWLITRTANAVNEFRMSLKDGKLGYYDEVHPAYTIFNRESKTFSGIWTEYSESYNEFLAGYERDSALYSTCVAYAPKAGTPENSINISMMPWTTFTAVNLNLYNGGTSLLPIFTMGRAFMQSDRRMLPLAVQAHHAVCDGYHLGRFLSLLQININSFKEISSDEH